MDEWGKVLRDKNILVKEDDIIVFKIEYNDFEHYKYNPENIYYKEKAFFYHRKKISDISLI